MTAALAELDFGEGDLPRRRRRGKRAYLSGLSAEEAVSRAYRDRGLEILHRRWRGAGGEIDLILQEGNEIVFAEVKASAHMDVAIASLRSGQMARIHRSAEEYVGTLPSGSLTPVRFDLATVDGQGAVSIHEGAFSHF